ncbi:MULTISPECIES: hypothetical protein [Pseudomonas]|uniref:Uncharacterized protein n=1 Tax=Pseudomonas putida TaxID=303 RepID=A0AAD0LC88_PSEPU|nr:hypothetical protein [Pseudomonas putida]AXA26725.1 hypothetical protein C1S65_22355 [Pseudomonas putida]HEK1686003.1 hypothetical protein [Pseudomonas putida]
MTLLRTALIALAMTSGLAQASSPDAWNEYRQQMVKRCLAASQFKDAHALGKPAEFDDRTAYSALLIEGVYKPKSMKNQTGTELCLYDRAQQQAYVTEWKPGAK